MMTDLNKLFSVGREIKIKDSFAIGRPTKQYDIIKSCNYIGKIINVFSSFITVMFADKTLGKATYNILYNTVKLGEIEHLRNYPHILYRLLDCQEEQNNPRDLLVFIEDSGSDASEEGFNWVETSEGIDFWKDIMNDNVNLDTIKYDTLSHSLYIEDNSKDNNPSTHSTITNIPNNSFKPNQHAIRLQKPHSVITRGTVPEGNRVCSREHKVAISSRPLSYSACFVRS